jgi:REP element-mobilizing transposase RayT
VIPRRRLPHIYKERRWLFVTFHLHGSLPHAMYPPPGKLSAGKAFVWIDRRLDTSTSGPMFLRQKDVAGAVVSSLRQGMALRHYDLGPFVIMPNHVHVLLLPLVPPSRLLKSLKGATAREANRILCRTGEPFWQAESYDHWVRDEGEWNRIASYIEANPVRAGFVTRPEEFPWSSANGDLRLRLVEPCVHTRVDARG